MPPFAPPQILARIARQSALVLSVCALAGCAHANDTETDGPGVTPAGTTCDPSLDRALPRRIRLLTRREYDATVRDLFSHATSMGPSCEEDTGCDIASSSCVGGVCVADPCTLHTFVFDAGATTPTSVHVAGTFNNWPQTIAGGGWEMEPIAGTSLWYTKRSLPEGAYEYKLVLNETTWIADPKNPVTVGDFGNSALQVSCPAGGGTSMFPESPAEAFPAESRPTGYLFDNAASAIVTSVHVDHYLEAAKVIASAATADLTNVAGCDLTIDAEGCADDFLADFGRRAFRRPLSDEERARYKALILGQSDKKVGAEIALRVMLSSPSFLYRFEIGAPSDNGLYRLTAYEIAAELSYTYWGTMPDEALLERAAEGALDAAEDREAEAKRLMADPKSRPVIQAFFTQWLGIEKLATASKSEALFPGFTADVRRDAVIETQKLTTDIFFDGSHKYADLLTSKDTFVSPALATFYGMDIQVSDWQRTKAPEARGAGLLGHASLLASFAAADQSSPIKRGLFVRRHLLCQEFPAPPADAATTPAVDPSATTRERFAQHTANPVCKSCHQYIDDVGFGFERFDAVGQYRETENGLPVDAAGDMNDVEGLGTGTHAPFASLAELGEILAASEAGPACFARQSYRFVTGAMESDADGCALSDLEAKLAETDGDMMALFVAMATLDEFVVRR